MVCGNLYFSAIDVVYWAKYLVRRRRLKVLQITVLVIALVYSTGVAFAQNSKVLLVWDSAADAVLYEVEVAKVPLLSSQQASEEQTLYRTMGVFTPGMELNLALLKEEKLENLFYRVRPLNLDKEPIGVFSQPISLKTGVMNPSKPQPTSKFDQKRPTPLYPVYAWIPVQGASRYEVEITDRLPENPNGIAASAYRIRSYQVEGGFNCYDLHAYRETGKYYWRVRAMNEENKPIGTYSDAISFTVTRQHYRWAVFGDSISHGGGAVSNPPSDERYEYVSYLPFPVKNLGKSGDTIEMLVERFERDVLPFTPKYLLVLGGTNSIREGRSGESVIASLEIIKAKCKQNGITPIFLTLPPMNPERIQRVFNYSIAKGWKNELGKVNYFIRRQPNFVETYLYLADEEGFLVAEYGEDGLHPDISGKKIIADSINAFLQEHQYK